MEYHFSVESTEIENASLPYKTVIPEANAKTNRIVSTKWTYYKKRSFDFFELLYSYKELIWCTSYQNIRIHAWSSIWRCFIPVSILYLSTCRWLIFNLLLWSLLSLSNITGTDCHRWRSAQAVHWNICFHNSRNSLLKWIFIPECTDSRTSYFVIPVTFSNKTVAFCNKKIRHIL